ncbi:MAG: hypothetical protein ACK4UN_13030 [Limisphaerales bacterium]
MNYAIVQGSLDIPDVEKLKRAFRSVSTLTDVDAHILANDAFGILVKGKTADQAGRLLQALRAEGIEAEMIPQHLLPQMPATKFVRKLECTPDALILHDPLGRPFPLPWQHIMMLAAGNVKVVEFNRHAMPRQVTRYTANGQAYTTQEVDYNTREEHRFQFLLEIILTRSVLRYSVTVDKPMLFQYLGSQFNPKLEQSFGILVRHLLQFAPQAALNRGAYYFRENASEAFSYPSKNAFHEEIIWLLWKMQQ